ncbi:MAG: hypothetical protein KAW92_03665 [Candidatus Cloacimonetes bacterium]|nr:hypothetical protein [Candidatus Cloacimonadota bacterium]
MKTDNFDNDLIPELELDIIPTQNGELQIELMHKDFIVFLKKQKFLMTDIIFIPLSELKNCIKRLRKAYEEYKKE